MRRWAVDWGTQLIMALMVGLMVGTVLVLFGCSWATTLRWGIGVIVLMMAGVTFFDVDAWRSRRGF